MKCNYLQGHVGLSAASVVVFIVTCLAAGVDVIIFPKDPSRVKAVDELINDSIHGLGKIFRLTSQYRPEYSGIECWRVNAEESELERLKTQLLPGDVSMTSHQRSMGASLRKLRL